MTGLRRPKVTVVRTKISAEFLSKISGLGSGARDRVVERTGRRAPDGTIVLPGDGVVLEHDDGRVQTGVMARTVTAHVERDLGRDLNGFRRLMYDRARRLGVPHDEAIHRLFPEGKVTV